MLRPFFSYFGGKWTLAPLYPERAPQIAAMWRWLIGTNCDEIMSLPSDATSIDGVHENARTLIGFWCARGRTRPGRPSSWMTSNRWPTSFWGERTRERIAAQVEAIRHWQIIEGDYSAAPDVEATWFIDPPYEGARYIASVDDYAALARWCRARRGLAIVCEQNEAAWLPFRQFREAKNLTHRSYREVVWIQRTEGNQISLAL